jgi:hypothetical protein
MATDRLSRLVRLAAMSVGLGITAAMLVGCEPAFDHAEVIAVSDATGLASVDTTRIVLPIGVVVRVTFRAINEDGADMPGNFGFLTEEGAPFRLVPDDDPDSVVLVGETVSDQASPLHVVREGDVVLSIPVTVIDQ